MLAMSSFKCFILIYIKKLLLLTPINTSNLIVRWNESALDRELFTVVVGQALLQDVGAIRAMAQYLRSV